MSTSNHEREPSLPLWVFYFAVTLALFVIAKLVVSKGWATIFIYATLGIGFFLLPIPATLLVYLVVGGPPFLLFKRNRFVGIGLSLLCMGVVGAWPHLVSQEKIKRIDAVLEGSKLAIPLGASSPRTIELKLDRGDVTCDGICRGALFSEKADWVRVSRQEKGSRLFVLGRDGACAVSEFTDAKGEKCILIAADSHSPAELVVEATPVESFAGTASADSNLSWAFDPLFVRGHTVAARLVDPQYPSEPRILFSKTALKLSAITFPLVIRPKIKGTSDGFGYEFLHESIWSRGNVVELSEVLSSIGYFADAAAIEKQFRMTRGPVEHPDLLGASAKDHRDDERLAPPTAMEINLAVAALNKPAGSEYSADDAEVVNTWIFRSLRWKTYSSDAIEIVRKIIHEPRLTSTMELRYVLSRTEVAIALLPDMIAICRAGRNKNNSFDPPYEIGAALMSMPKELLSAYEERMTELRRQSNSCLTR